MTPNHQSGASTRVYGQPSANANTNQGSGVARDKPKAKKRYRWPNGSIHSRPYRGHGGGNAGGGNNGGGGGGGAPPPKPVDPLTQRAQQYGNLAYGGLLGSIRQDQANATPYFDAYRAQVAAASQNYTNQSAPVLQQAQQTQQTAGTVAQGAENDPEAQLAAQSRAALTGLGLLTLQTQVNSNQGYFAGQQGPVAAAGEVGLKTNLNREYGQAVKDRGAYVAKTREELRQEQHKEQLEEAAFGVDVQKANTDAANTAADNRRANRQDRQQRQRQNQQVNSWGYSDKDWRSFSPEKRRQIMKQVRAEQRQTGTGGADGLTPAQQRAAKKERGKAINRVKEIGDLYGEYSNGKVTETGPDGKPRTRKPTPEEVKARLRKEGYSQSELTVALRVRSGKPLTAGQRATARRMGIYPIPKRWKQPKANPNYGGGHGGAEGPNGQYRPT